MIRPRICWRLLKDEGSLALDRLRACPCKPAEVGCLLLGSLPWAAYQYSAVSLAR